MSASQAVSKSGAISFMAWALLLSVCCELQAIEEVARPEETPELEDIRYLIARDEAPQGVLLHTREYDEDAYIWVAPRLEYYVYLLREKFPDVPVIIISHGDEMRSFTHANRVKYQRVHAAIKHMVEMLEVDFQVCGSFASYNNIDASEFPEYIIVIPSAPAAFTDYRELGYDLIEVELSW
ncbi:MAG: hypothetical protein P8171_16510 [Candidatus Thiodiazotropha sp.]